MPTLSLVTMSRSQASTQLLVCSPPVFSCVRVPATSSPRPGPAPIVTSRPRPGPGPVVAAPSAWLLVTSRGELVRVGRGGGEVSLTR